MYQGEHHIPKMTRGATIGFIAVTVAFVVMGIILGNNIKQNREALTRLDRTKADVTQLQSSNCTLKLALLKARIETYNRSIREGKSKEQALASIKNLTTIIVGMDGEHYCPTPNKYKVGKER